MNATETAQTKAQLELDCYEVKPLQAALDECKREWNVRERCFPGWIANGKVTATDAEDRLTRLGNAIHILELLLDTKREPLPV